MTAEVWPDRARGKGAGLMQCGLGIGFFIASFVWLFVSPLGPDAWRYMYLLGILPAFFTLWIRRGIPESSLWETSDRHRRTALERKRSGAALDAGEHALTRFTLVDLFAEPEVRRRTIFAFLMSLTTTLAWWGISTWVPPYVGSVAAKAGLPAQQWASYVAMASNGAAIIGYAGFGFLADVFGRKPVTMAYFALAFLSVPVFFIWTEDLTLLLLAGAFSGIFVSGQFTWMSAWLPELFPTRVRATATAFVFNAPRLISWTGPLISGWLIANFGGFSQAAVVIGTVYILGLVAAPFLPETRGKPLPD
jgi:MFS family permease